MRKELHTRPPEMYDVFPGYVERNICGVCETNRKMWRALFFRWVFGVIVVYLLMLITEVAFFKK